MSFNLYGSSHFSQENLIINRNKHDIAMDLIGEFVFRERKEDQRNQQQYQKQPITPRLTSIEEFQLVLVLCDFFSRPGPDATRNAVFFCLFGGSIGRSSVLNKLISTAVSGSIAPVSVECHKHKHCLKNIPFAASLCSRHVDAAARLYFPPKFGAGPMYSQRFCYILKQII